MALGRSQRDNALKEAMTAKKRMGNHFPKTSGPIWSKIEMLPAIRPGGMAWRLNWIQIANRTKLAISVMTVDASTATPKRVWVTLSSRMTGNTMPTECEANSEA